MKRFRVWKDFRFEAAHRLPFVGADHKCARMHGHSYRVRVTVEGPVDARGFVVDYAEISAVVAPLIARLDHATLNRVEGLENPTSEALLEWLWLQIRPGLPGVVAIEVQETDACGVVLLCG